MTVLERIKRDFEQLGVAALLGLLVVGWLTL
jgi:hypothetical protein